MKREETWFAIIHLESGEIVNEGKLLQSRPEAVTEFRDWFSDDWESYAITEVKVTFDDGRTFRGRKPKPKSPCPLDDDDGHNREWQVG